MQRNGKVQITIVELQLTALIASQCDFSKAKSGIKPRGASRRWAEPAKPGEYFCWRQIVSATALITFGQERYHVSAFPPRQWLKPVPGDILPGLE